MENQLSFVFLLPLKEMALRRVVINLWNQPDVLASIEKFPAMYQKRHSNFTKEWCKRFDVKVKDKVSKLVLPQSLKEQMLAIVTPIGLQIKTWKGLSEGYLQMPGCEGIFEKYLLDSNVKINAPILAKLCWTTSGKIDYRKTAEELIRYEMVDIVKRYQLACLYCLDDYIPVLWDELPEEIKGKFYNEDISKVKKPNLQFCWPYILKGEQSKLNCIANKNSKYTTFHQHAFDYSAAFGNKAATEYFLGKLTEEEKADSFISSVVDGIFRSIERVGFGDMFDSENLFDTLCYLLSQMNYEENMEILNYHSSSVFLCFMGWPCQDLFLKNACPIWAVVPAEHNDFLLEKMSEYFRYSKYYNPKFFQEFFTHSPMNFRKRFVYLDRRYAYFLRFFFHRQDTETVKVIFSNLDASDRLTLISSKHILRRIYNSILKGRRHKVKIFLRETALSKENTERLKEIFNRFLKRTDEVEIHKRKSVWMTFLQILDQIYASAQRKRCLEDENLNIAKKLCS